MNALPLGYLSVSQIRSYMTCPAQYEYKYIRQIKSTVKSSFVIGSSFHKAIETANKAKMEDGVILSEEELKDAYSDAWESRISKEEIEWEEGEDPGKLKDQGLEMTLSYYNEYGKNFKPLMIEIGFYIPIDGIPMKGYIDLVEADGSIRDFKTSRKSPNADEAENSIQLAAYAFAFRELTGQKESKVGLDYTVNLKSGPKIVRLEANVSEERIERLKTLIKGVANAIKSGIFYPVEEGFACSYCPYKSICKGGK